MTIGTSEIYILIAVLALITIMLVWFAAKTLADMRRRNKAQKARRQGNRRPH